MRNQASQARRHLRKGKGEEGKAKREGWNGGRKRRKRGKEERKKKEKTQRNFVIEEW